MDHSSYFFFFSSRRRHTRCSRDWSSDVCSSDLISTQGWDAVATTVEQGQRIIYLETQRLVLNSFIEMTWNRKTLIDQRLTAPRYKILRHRHVCGANFPPTHREIGRASCRERV